MIFLVMRNDSDGYSESHDEPICYYEDENLANSHAKEANLALRSNNFDKLKTLDSYYNIFNAFLPSTPSDGWWASAKERFTYGVRPLLNGLTEDLSSEDAC